MVRSAFKWLERGCHSADLSLRSSELLTEAQVLSAANDFLPSSTFSAVSSYSVCRQYVQPPCTITCIPIRVHIKIKIPSTVCHTIVWTHRNTDWGVSGAEQEYSLSKTKVKHNQAWSPNGSMHDWSWWILPQDFSGIKFCADSTKILWMRLQTEVPPYIYITCMHATTTKSHA